MFIEIIGVIAILMAYKVRSCLLKLLELLQF